MSLRISAMSVVTLTPGERLALTATGYDAHSNPATLPPLVWTTDSPDRVRVDADGAIEARGLGQSWIRASAPGLRDSVSVWVQKPESEPSTFEITLIYSDDVPLFWRERFEEAGARWERVVRDTLPGVDMATLDPAANPCSVVDGEQPLPPQSGVERGTRIFIAISHSFAPGTYVSAVGGPCLQRTLPHPTTILGQITLNRDFFDDPEDLQRMRLVAHHEMGHVLGIAGVVQGFQPDFIDVGGGIYRGHLALEGYRRQSGMSVTGLDISNGAHWPSAGLMGVTGPRDSIAPVSVGMLMDFGYPAAWYGAGALEDGSGGASIVTRASIPELRGSVAPSRTPPTK